MLNADFIVLNSVKRYSSINKYNMMLTNKNNITYY